MANQLQKIDHIVQLMLENRSFDQMLGFLYQKENNKSPAGQDFDGLSGEESNPDDLGNRITVFPIQGGTPHTYLMPGADPGEGFLNTNYQLYSTDDPAPGAQPTNQGFVINFKAAIASDLARNFSDTLPGTQPSQVMGMYTPDLLPILSTLARSYAVCDAWFASVPTETIPNRAFACAATSQGHMDDHNKTFTCPSIFGRLSDMSLDWAIFGYNSDPLTRHDFSDTSSAAESHFGHFRDFQAWAAAGTLPVYTFLEPSFGASGNSQHPNYDVSKGEQLIHDVYVALRSSPSWSSTLLIITYDEHGGNYDHVAPPTNATPPDDGTVAEFGFDFTRFGVRVPAVLVSPLIVPGTVFRGSGSIDHTSVLKTISERWGTKPLTKRDAAAGSLGDVLTLHTARTDDALAGVTPPTSNAFHPNSSVPSKIEMLHAARVASLPLRNQQGFYEETSTAPLTSAAEVSNFIRDRTAAWKEHKQRQEARRKQHASSSHSDNKGPHSGGSHGHGAKHRR